MNKWQAEVLGNRVASEEQVLKEIKASYKKALKEIDDKIAQLLGREDTENLQSIIYQVEYQKALKTQISAILDDLNTKQFNSVSQYLVESYQDGFIGTMYDLQKQGIPIVAPIEQKNVVRAIKTNTQLSTTLWGSLAEYNSVLQKEIRSEISRGISQGSSYSTIARNLAERMNVKYNQTARIVRTEAHRISQEATMDAQYKAKEKGADIVKQWDATLDRRTRSQHASLDGQIKELDEEFEYGGHSAMHPSGFGVASLDINCRCQLLQRAKWGLDEEELKALEERAAFFGLDKTKDYEEYKKKYLDIVDELKEEVTLDNFPNEFKANKKKEQNTQLLIEYINSQENADPRVVELITKLSQMNTLSSNNIPFEVKFGEKNAVTPYEDNDGNIAKASITLQDLTKNNTIGAYHTNLHELGHLIDLYNGVNSSKKLNWFTENVSNYKKILKESSTGMSQEIQDLFKKTQKQYKQINEEQLKHYNPLLNKINVDYYYNGAYPSYSAYKKAYNKTKKEYKDSVIIKEKNLGISNLEDIYDALSGGKYRDTGVTTYGHGVEYYKDYSNRIGEIFANYINLSVSNPNLVKLLKDDKPELVEMLDNMVEDILKTME